MSQAQGKKQKNAKADAASHSEIAQETLNAQDTEKTQALTQAELVQMLEGAKGEWSMSPRSALSALKERADEGLTLQSIPVVQCSLAEAPRGMPARVEPDEPGNSNVEAEAFFQEAFALSAENNEVPGSFLEVKKAKYVEEDTRPGALIAVDAALNGRGLRAMPPVSNSASWTSRGFLLIGVLIGMLVGGSFFMLVYGLLLDF
ncbi:MAG: hypothetical protein FWG75_07560 [Cystobacterineae bacterium]|nr:hypothetical protein [Cystobacterineae bacterium]